MTNILLWASPNELCWSVHLTCNINAFKGAWSEGDMEGGQQGLQEKTQKLYESVSSTNAHTG